MPTVEGILLTLVVFAVFVNGWTDAPNAIACAVSTRSLSFHRAVALAATCNLLGIVVMGALNASVASTVTGLAGFGSSPASHSIAALCAAMISIVLFAVSAWFFGIPTSESHALMAALMGAGFALGGPVVAAPLIRVLLGLVFSITLAFGLGSLLSRLLSSPLQRLGGRALRGAQIASAAGMAFMHGAQDGQKFFAILVLADRLAHGTETGSAIRCADHIPAMLLCAAAMALGTSVGGGRILVTVGQKMVSLQKQEGVCADLGAGLCLLLASLTGIPMSTTHTKTTAMMGAAFAFGRKRVDIAVVRSMFLAWTVTFPVCGALGFLLTRALIRLLP